MRVAIVGSRDYPNLEEVAAYVEQLSQETWIVSGGARGVDTAAEEAAKRTKRPYLVFPANWDAYGKSAGPKRNKLIVDNSDFVVAFQHNKSGGTQMTIDYARSQGKDVEVYDSQG